MEQVLVVKTNDMDNFISSNDLYRFIDNSEKDSLYNLAIANSFFLDRDFAETDFSSRQLIPYAILRHQDSIYVLERKSKQSEKRLHNKLSIGIGGHINPIDLEGNNDVIQNCLNREVNEEVKIEGSYTADFIGIIIDNSTEVSKVHLGIAFEIRLDNPSVEIREVDKMSGKWIKLDEISHCFEQMETWSQIALDHYINK